MDTRTTAATHCRGSTVDEKKVAKKKAAEISMKVVPMNDADDIAETCEARVAAAGA